MDTGTVISGTMRAEDLIPAFCSELSIRNAAFGAGDSEFIRAIEARAEVEGYYESDATGWDLEELFDLLNECAPDGHYFGAHPGDGADYGYWAVEED